MESEIFFNDQATRLQGRLRLDADERAVIVTHPHPLYGGTMDNGVVSAIVEAYGHHHWTTLRFNFRGIGRSQGQYDEGIGEQDDVAAAIAYLRERNFQRIDLAGYSFGSWVLANWSRRNSASPHRIRFVAPPVAFVDFDASRPFNGLTDIFAGSRDELAPVDRIREEMPAWQPTAKLHVIDGADHFFINHLSDLRTAIIAMLSADR